MHINLNMRSCNGNSMKTHFKVDTGADGNLLPLGEFFTHFPQDNLKDLTKMVDPHTKLYTYNNTEIVYKPNSSIRLCLDPTHLNKYILRPHHNSKTLDDILLKWSGAKKFSIVDSTKLFFNLGLT